uniref:Uncharacterized protein n=2 Tax=Octactis speculum TaxID=3111310 RepID=A0A7S2B398_9STRA|mmetsp:Transcript_18490/g.25070  ORF Transcript_18490/g.25070 Transcript_18490/m.25070 type:complete len:678 (+) Transcript_18490:181-2214(+)
MAGADDLKSINPYLVALEKRSRAARKKKSRIQLLEESLATGKPLNDSQTVLLNSKSEVDCRLMELDAMREALENVASTQESFMGDPSMLSGTSSPVADTVTKPESKDASQGTEDTSECAATQTEVELEPEKDEEQETGSITSEHKEPTGQPSSPLGKSDSVRDEEEVRELVRKECGQAVSAAVSGLVQLMHVHLHYTTRMQNVTGASSPLPETLNFFGKVVLGQTASPEHGFAEAMQQSVTDALKYVHGAEKPVHVNGESYCEMSLTVQRLANELKALDLLDLEEPDINFFASPPPPPSPPPASPKQSVVPALEGSGQAAELLAPGITYTAPPAHPGSPVIGDFGKQVTQAPQQQPSQQEGRAGGFVSPALPPGSMPQNTMPPGSMPPGTMAQGTMPQAMAMPLNGLQHPAAGGPMSVPMQMPHGRIPPHHPSMMPQEGQFYAPGWTSLHNQELAHVSPPPQEVAFTNGGAPFYPANVALQGGHWHHNANANGHLGIQQLPGYGFPANNAIDPASSHASSHVASHSPSGGGGRGQGGDQPSKLGGPAPSGQGGGVGNRSSGRQRRTGNRVRGDRRGGKGRGEGKGGGTDAQSANNGANASQNGHAGGGGGGRGSNTGEEGGAPSNRGVRHRNGEKRRGRPRMNGASKTSQNTDHEHEQGGETASTNASGNARDKAVP